MSLWVDGVGPCGSKRHDETGFSGVDSPKGRENKGFPEGMLASRRLTVKRDVPCWKTVLSVDRSVSNARAAHGKPLPQTGFVADYAACLLRAAGMATQSKGLTGTGPDDPHAAWAQSGAMALTGAPKGPALLAAAPLATAARGAVEALRPLAGPVAGVHDLDGAMLLGERAAILALERQGRTAPGGGCRLLPARDGWLAVNLARESDREMLEAWLETDAAEDPWAQAQRVLPRRDVAFWLDRSRLLGMPVAEAAREVVGGTSPFGVRVALDVPGPQGDPTRVPRVVDLSSLWAGPLCGHLLERAGSRVIKCESVERPDGARRGASAFFDLLNANKRSVAFEFSRREGRAGLVQLLESADIVIESARPRALAGFGIDAEAWVAARSGRTWLSITGYGRAQPEAEWVAFGDDAAAASGLAWATASFHGRARPLFCGDAIADPLAGLHAAVVALASFRRGGSRLLDVSLRGVVASILELAREEPYAPYFSPDRARDASPREVAQPHAREPAGRAHALGADTRDLMNSLASDHRTC